MFSVNITCEICVITFIKEEYSYEILEQTPTADEGHEMLPEELLLKHSTRLHEFQTHLFQAAMMSFFLFSLYQATSYEMC